MAKVALTLSNAVGIRYATAMMPNLPGDLATVMELFDRTQVANGGTAEIALPWASDRNALITQVAAQIGIFQARHALQHKLVIDGVFDKNGASFRLLNQLAFDRPLMPVESRITAIVSPPPSDERGSYNELKLGQTLQVASPMSLPGTAPLEIATISFSIVRRLVQVEGSSINWFGVAIPLSEGTPRVGRMPHIHFTPSPIQGGYVDQNYSSFKGWGGLWGDYTFYMGGHMAASGADQVLVLPFYRTSQHSNLGSFLSDWKEVVEKVLTAAINSIDPYALRDTYVFDSIVSSSFSNGWIPHAQFQGKGLNVNAMTRAVFEIDGSAARPPCYWRPPKGAVYIDKPAPSRSNPIGNIWYVGNRWQKFQKALGNNAPLTHQMCRNHLLYHGLRQNRAS